MASGADTQTQAYRHADQSNFKKTGARGLRAPGLKTHVSLNITESRSALVISIASNTPAIFQVELKGIRPTVFCTVHALIDSNGCQQQRLRMHVIFLNVHVCTQRDSLLLLPFVCRKRRSPVKFFSI